MSEGSKDGQLQVSIEAREAWAAQNSRNTARHQPGLLASHMVGLRAK